MEHSKSKEVSSSKLNMSCDRQIRSCVLAWSKDTRYTKKVEPISNKMPNGSILKLYNQLVNVLKVGPDKFYMTFNGQGRARSQYLHLKAFIKPEECIAKELYPKWARHSVKDIQKCMEDRWDTGLFKYLKDISTNDVSEDNKAVYIPDGYLHGVYDSHVYDSNSLDGGILALEKYMFQMKFKGVYNIIIYPRLSGKTITFVLAAQVNEDEFTKVWKHITIISEPYKEPIREYYIKSRNVDDKSFILPTGPTLIYKPRQKRQSRWKN